MQLAQELRVKLGKGKGKVTSHNEPCQTKVKLPTVIVGRRGLRGNPVFVQWFEDCSPGNAWNGNQYLFDLFLADSDERWALLNPENFAVVALSPLERCVTPAVTKIVQEGAREGLKWRNDLWIAWFMKPGLQVEHITGPGPASFMVPLLPIADARTGLIRPRFYDGKTLLLAANWTPFLVSVPNLRFRLTLLARELRRLHDEELNRRFCRYALYGMEVFSVYRDECMRR